MQKSILAAIIACCCAGSASAQSDKAQSPEKIFTDTYKGKIPLDHKTYITTLILQHHCKYCDEGKFTLRETSMESTAGAKAIEIKGDWTVIKGDAENQYATVVEIDAGKDTLYFLRWQEGHLQKLDAQLREIKPVTKYLLRKQ